MTGLDIAREIAGVALVSSTSEEKNYPYAVGYLTGVLSIILDNLNESERKRYLDLFTKKND